MNRILHSTQRHRFQGAFIRLVDRLTFTRLRLLFTSHITTSRKLIEHCVKHPQWRQEPRRANGKSQTLMPRARQQQRDTIREIHGCDCIYLKSVSAHDIFENETTWRGLVSVFYLIKHSKAKHCYAWSYRDGEETKTVTALEIPATR